MSSTKSVGSYSPTTRTMILEDVALEMARQRQVWGEQNHPDTLESGNKYALKAEEYKIRCDIRNKNNENTWDLIFLEEVYEALEQAVAGDRDKLAEELIQVAAVACSWHEALYRRNK